MRVSETDGNEKCACYESKGMDEDLLAPDAEMGINRIGDETTSWAERNVQETEHGGPTARAGLSQDFEVLQIVVAEDGVDGQFSAEGAEIGASLNEGL